MSAGVPDAKVLTNATPVPVTRTSIPTPGLRLIWTDQSSGNAAEAFRSSFSWSARRMRNVIRMLATVPRISCLRRSDSPETAIPALRPSRTIERAGSPLNQQDR